MQIQDKNSTKQSSTSCILLITYKMYHIFKFNSFFTFVDVFYLWRMIAKLYIVKVQLWRELIHISKSQLLVNGSTKKLQIVLGTVTAENNSFMICRKEIGIWNYHLSNLMLCFLYIPYSFNSLAFVRIYAILMNQLHMLRYSSRTSTLSFDKSHTKSFVSFLLVLRASNGTNYKRSLTA